jgi:5-(carboxyamino)imidazole ribonucleotide synthase
MSAEGASQAESIASRIASAINVVGVLAVELFETADGRILVNELAMRPHNSGHVFTELSLTSQFEQHLRAVADYPLGAPELIQEFGVMANVFGRLDGHLARLAAEEFPAVKIHDYQKAPRLGRKVGHCVAVGTSVESTLTAALAARAILEGENYDG